MNLAFIGPFKHAGLALSIGLGACLNAGSLCYLLIKRGIYVPQSGWRAFLSKLIIAVIVMVGFLILSKHYLPLDFNGESYIRVLSLFILLIIAITSYFISLFVMGFRIHHFTQAKH